MKKDILSTSTDRVRALARLSVRETASFFESCTSWLHDRLSKDDVSLDDDPSKGEDWLRDFVERS